MKKNLIASLLITLLYSCFDEDEMTKTANIQTMSHYIGEVNCPKNYKVFTVKDSETAIVEKFTSADTITIKGIKYKNVFFAEFPIDKLHPRFNKNLEFDELYLVYGVFPLKRGTISCDKYKNYYEKVAVKSVD